ncbi:FAS1 domain-containing protein [Moesziomyces antarcticus]|uniref:FAS1 domain-containing protein n=1 Tax=Pseudozyma antarctica TaxID=84753 RepID=UPI000719551E|nr:FAS1 domain-containing protein [Moesziomyces antarcticus]GAK62415.1 FAS1 domain-containing protein [Moesziomyces antarcticus]
MLAHRFLVAAAALACLCTGGAEAAQHPLQLAIEPVIPTRKHNDTSSFNLVDLLSQSPDHTIFVRLLQRTRLIPTLNRLQEFDDGSGITILAPTNDAFLSKKQQQLSQLHAASQAASRSHTLTFWEYLLDDLPHTAASAHCIWNHGICIQASNVNAVARQHLLYHVLNYTLPFTLSDNTGSHAPDHPLPQPGKPQMHTTLHFPSRRMLTEPTHPGRVPVPDEEDHGGLLGHHGQRMRIALVDRTDKSQPDATSNKQKRPSLYFGADEQGCGGAMSLFEDWRSRSGVIHHIDSVISLPPSLEHVIATHPSLDSVRHLMNNDTLHTLSTVPHLTLFMPTSQAFDKLSALESAYLFGNFEQASLDRLKLLGWHSCGSGFGDRSPVYSAALRAAGRATLATTLGGSVSIEVDQDDGSIKVMDAHIVQEDILTENGVVHLIDDLILPFGDLDMSIEATLLALNATRFVDLVYEAGLQHYINKPAHLQRQDGDPFTFLAPRDDVIDSWYSRHPHIAHYAPDTSRSLGNYRKGPSLEEVVRYHILPGQIRPANLTSGMLLNTELQDWKLREGRQKMPVQVGDTSASETRGNGDVAFGDANVISEPVEVKDSAVIYVVSQLLQPPSDPIQTAVSYLSLSTFVATVFSSDLKKAVERAPGVSYLIPTNDAFTGLGLAMNYLLLPDSQHLLQALVEYHAIDRIAYKADFTDQEAEFPTLLPTLGAKLAIRRQKSGTIAVHQAGEPNGTASLVIKGDILTNTGVIHEVDRVQIPFDLTIRDLLKGAKADTMEDLMVQAGYEYVLNSTIPKNQSIASASGFLVLVPTDSAFTKVNLTAVLADQDRLVRLVQQHLIPLVDDKSVDELLPDGRGDGIELKDESSYATLLDRANGGPSAHGQVSFRRTDPRTSRYKRALSDGEPDEGLGWIVGIKNTRGSSSDAHSAVVTAFGREARGIRGDVRIIRPPVGGVFQIDAVLTPYEPGWFYRWGWIALLCAAVTGAVASLAVFAVRWWRRGKRIQLPEALEGEEE